ncbi:PADRE domain [Dillenia turbinata]|uniref:PADRE domain n=1 Tax=Dillenia turbinata TaxID=194707 RepID=A0AAN8W0D9_9MAGN
MKRRTLPLSSMMEKECSRCLQAPKKIDLVGNFVSKVWTTTLAWPMSLLGEAHLLALYLDKYTQNTGVGRAKPLFCIRLYVCYMIIGVKKKMGGCLSFSQEEQQGEEQQDFYKSKYSSSSTTVLGLGLAVTAKVLSLDGRLREYYAPVKVSQILGSQEEETDSGDDYSSMSCFLCNADTLYYDEHIPAMDGEDLVYPNNMYFVLPSSMLRRRLTPSDLAALAVKASLALQQQSAISKSGSGCFNNIIFQRIQRCSNRVRVSPVILSSQHQPCPPKLQKKRSDASGNMNSSSRPQRLVVSRSASLRRLHKYSSKRAKMAVRSFRITLSTIYEGSVLL